MKEAIRILQADKAHANNAHRHHVMQAEHHIERAKEEIAKAEKNADISADVDEALLKLTGKVEE
jgi:hypothetical protein